MASTLDEQRDRLLRRLDKQALKAKVYRDYYDGNHPIKIDWAAWRLAFGGRVSPLADNWCRIVVDASVELLRVEGFRYGQTLEADADAWAMWQANRLDQESIQGHTEAVKCGQAFVMVAPPAVGEQWPLITIEHPTQMVVEHMPGMRRTVIAALKRWRDEDGYIQVVMMARDAVASWRSRRPYPEGSDSAKPQWEQTSAQPNLLREVTVFPLENNPDLLDGGISDLDPMLPLQDSVNVIASDMLVASKHGAFKQKWSTGIPIPKNADGSVNRQAALKNAMSELAMAEKADARFGQFEATELANYVDGLRYLRTEIAALTRTPPHYILGEIVNASGDALTAAQAGLVAKTQRKILDFGETWEDAIACGFRMIGDPRGRQTDSESIWANPERQSDAQLLDAAVKAQQLGVPLEVIWARYLNASPQQISQWAGLANLPARPGSLAAPPAAPPELPAPTQ